MTRREDPSHSLRMTEFAQDDETRRLFAGNPKRFPAFLFFAGGLNQNIFQIKSINSDI
jgi:hypothetical protein